MSYLPLANILHRKLRSALCALAVGIGIAMLVVMLGLSHGTLDEVAQRMESVPAELLVLPRGESAIYMGGGYFGPAHEEQILDTTVDGARVVRRVVPVFWLTAPVGGQKQRVFGIDPKDADAVFGRYHLVEGKLFDADGRFHAAVEDAIRHAAANRPDAERAIRNGGYVTDDMPADVLALGREIVIDRRLQRVAGIKVGDEVPLFGEPFRVVGVVETGAAGRVFAPIDMLRHIATSGIRKSTMFFVELGDPTQAERAGAAIEENVGDAQVVLKSEYGRILFESFAQIYMYINIASGVALVVCFLFILLTMYTLVLERTREIGILRSLGATRRYIVRLAIEESLLLCVGGTLTGITLSYVAKYVIEYTRPLMTVQLTWQWIALALVVGVIGGVGSAIYPGYRAARLDPASALAYE